MKIPKMIKTKPVLLACAFALTGAATSEAATLFYESFDNASGFTASTPFFSDGAEDYLGLAGDGDDFGASPSPSSLKAYTGFTGGYLTGMDLDGEGSPSLQTFTWEGINIFRHTELEFSGDFAEFLDGSGSIDAGDQLFIEVQIDGNGFTRILEFTPGSFSSGSFNGFFELDTDSLGSAAQTFSAPIAGTGSSMDLRLTVDLDAGGEDFGVDNFQITGDPIPEPSAALLAIPGLGILAFHRRR